MRKIIYIIMMMLLPAMVMAQTNESATAFKEIDEASRSVRSIECDFTQTKTSKMLKSAITSTGHLIIANKKITLLYNNKKKMSFDSFSVSQMQDRKQFKTQITGTAEEWIIRMQPVQKRMSRMYSMITLHFNRKLDAVDMIEMLEKSGSKTEIQLHNIHKNK